MKLKELIGVIDHVIPPSWALPNDPIGLHVGDPNQDVTRVVVGLEASSQLLAFTKKKRAQALLVHHPLIFQPLKKVVSTQPVQRLVQTLIKNDIALYACHTNMDLHPQGMGKIWAEKLGCNNTHIALPKPQADQLKIVTFVPPDYVNAVRLALGEAGAGIIGEYDLCSYNLQGEGTFRGSEHSNPFAGKAGQFETENEIRLEMILPKFAKDRVVQALYTTHPYEEPAYDLYPMADFKSLKQAIWYGEFSSPISFATLAKRIEKSLPRKPEIGGVLPSHKKKIKRIAIATGSGNSFLPMLPTNNIDLFLTGEMGYHLQWEANEMGLPIVTVGHGASESLFPEAIIPLLKKHCDDVEWIAQAKY